VSESDLRSAGSRRFLSPLRYPGGKSKVANYFKLLLLENDMVGYEYVEPYAGGAGVALSLLYEEYVSHVHINDLDRSVHAFWSVALEQTEALCQRISETPVTVAEWERQQLIQEATDPDPLDLGFSTFFLNRTNRSGIIRGGVIGGKTQKGPYDIAARFNKPNLIQRIRKVGRYRNRITLTALDTGHYLREVARTLPREVLLYLDPPYFVKGGGLYQNSYEHGDHAEIAALVEELDRPWVVSYDCEQQILHLYERFSRIRYGLSYSAADRYRGGEVMFFSEGLRRPDVPSPANIKFAAVDRVRLQRVHGGRA